MIRKKVKKITVVLLCLAMGVSSLAPMDDSNAAVTAFTRKKAYVLTDSAKIKKIICEYKTEKLRYPKRKLVMNIKREKKYVIKYVTAKNKKKTLYLYADWTKPSVEGVKNDGEYKKTVKITVADKVSGLESVTLNGENVGKKITVSEVGDYKLVVKDRANNKRVVKFSIIEESKVTPAPTSTENSNGGGSEVVGTVSPTVKSTATVSTNKPNTVATPKATQSKNATCSPTPVTKEEEKAAVTSEVTSAPTVAPTEVPKKTYEVKVQVPQAWSSSTVYLYSYYTDSNAVKVEPNGTWANATVMTRDNSLSGYWYSANITLPQGQTAYVLVKNSNGQQRPEAQSQGYAVSGNTWVDLYGSVSSSKPSVVPTEVPATPTPAPATPLPEHCGTESELANWDYEKIEAKKGNTIVLNSYNGSSTSITVRAKYCINGTIYNTDFRSTSNYTPGGANDSSELPTFYDNPVLETVTIDGEIDATSGVWLFGKCSHLRSVKGLANIHTKDCSYMFRECKALFYIDGIPTGADRCTEMFMYTDFSLSGLNITIPNTVTECERMFSVSKISKISGYIGSNVNNAKSMFMNCYNLTDSSGFEVHAKDCTYMFYRCLKMSTRPILGSEITKDESMFDQCA